MMEAITPEEEEQLRTLIRVLATISTFLGSFVTLTYSLFPEKRQTNTSFLIFTQTLAASFLEASFMLAGYFGDALADRTGLCYFQAASFMFFGCLLQFTWFFVTLNLFLRVGLDRPEPHVIWALSISLLGSAISTAIPFLTGSVKNDGMWCFIDSENEVILFTCFYGSMIFFTVLGTPLWACIIYRMGRFLREERKMLMTSSSSRRGSSRFDRRSGYGSTNDSSTYQSSEDDQGEEVEVPHIRFSQKLMLLLRQSLYVTGFFVIFYVMLTNRIIITVSGDSYVGWLIHTIAIGLIGVYIFIIFGFTEQNLKLWRNLFQTLLSNEKSPSPSASGFSAKGHSVVVVPAYR